MAGKDLRENTLHHTGQPMGDGYCGSFNGSMRDELLNGEICYILAKAQILIEAWRRHYNTVRPHSSLGYRPVAPEAATPPWRRRQFYTNEQHEPRGRERKATASAYQPIPDN
jgi:transposase InsO family protein